MTGVRDGKRRDDAGRERDGAGDEPQQLLTVLTARATEGRHEDPDRGEQAQPEQDDGCGSDRADRSRQPLDCPRTDQPVGSLERRRPEQGAELKGQCRDDGDRWEDPRET